MMSTFSIVTDHNGSPTGTGEFQFSLIRKLDPLTRYRPSYSLAKGSVEAPWVLEVSKFPP